MTAPEVARADPWAGLRLTVRYGAIALVAVNVAVFLAQPWYLTRWLSLPVIQVGGVPLYWSLVADTQLVVAGQWYRLVTANFLHLAWDHFLLDAVALLILGWTAERLVGTRLVIVSYVLIGTSAIGAAFALERCQSLLGASAAVYGLLGVVVGYTARHAIHLRQITPQVRNMALLTGALLLLEPVTGWPGTDHLAHLWGLATGVPIGLCAWPFDRSGRWPLASVLVGLAVLTAGLVVWRDLTFAGCTI
jgi:membrane associated rhomboid family serine protease